MDGSTLFNSFLTGLGVPHTPTYSARRVTTMPFATLFGLSELLKEYGIANQSVRLEKKEEFVTLPVPSLICIDNTVAILTGVAGDKVSVQTDRDRTDLLTREEFIDRWNGIVMLAYPTDASIEPDYKLHLRDEIADKAKRWVLLAACLFLFTYLFVANGLYRHVSTVLLTLLNIAGLFITYLLVLKQVSIHSHTADKICGIIQQNGCNTVLQTKAAKFFGLFGWSEVGFAYFGVSLLTLLIFPQYIGYLALTNACCLPFSFWSVWYQKTRAKAWCTLCLCVQCTLWLLFFCFLGGGWFHYAHPVSINLLVLWATYLAALLVLNRLLAASGSSPKS